MQSAVPCTLGVGVALPCRRCSQPYRGQLVLVLLYRFADAVSRTVHTWCWCCFTVSQMQSAIPCTLGVGVALPCRRCSQPYRAHLVLVLLYRVADAVSRTVHTWCWCCFTVSQMQSAVPCTLGVGVALPCRRCSQPYRAHLVLVLLYRIADAVSRSVYT